MNIVSNCPLCEEHSLHILGEEEAQMMQCLNCGYTSTSKFVGDKETNEEYNKLTEDIPEEEQKNYPVPGDTEQYYERRYDIDNAKEYDEFFEGMVELNSRLKEEANG